MFLIQYLGIKSQNIEWKDYSASFDIKSNSPVKVFKYEGKLVDSPFIAGYVAIRLMDKRIEFDTDTTKGRRLTPYAFFERNNNPLIVVNGTFFEFESNENLNLVMNNCKVLSNGRTMRNPKTSIHAFSGAIGITEKRTADVAWVISDKKAYASQISPKPIKNTNTQMNKSDFEKELKTQNIKMDKWKMEAAIAGGPVLIQNGEISIHNENEMKFVGKAIHDRHPRTVIGYTKEELIILAIQGRSIDAVGAKLQECAEIMKNLGCIKALNLDGGGSTCLLVNGKELIKPSDKTGQRAIPAVFIIREKNKNE